MKPIRQILGKRAFLAFVLALALALLAGAGAPAWSQDSDPATSLQAFNRAALQGDLDTVGGLLSGRFLASTRFAEQKSRDPERLKHEVRLMSFYQVLQQEVLSRTSARVKVVQQKLVGRQGFVTRWYYMVREGNLWKLDSIGLEESYGLRQMPFSPPA